MPDHLPFDDVRQSGEHLLEVLREFNPDLGCDAASVEWLDGYVERNRHVFTDQGRYGAALGFGYVLGETLCRMFGGRWEYGDDQQEWIVELGPPVGQANPIGKAYKHLSGLYDSMASMLRVTQIVIEKGGWDHLSRGVPEKDESSKPSEP